MAAPTTAKPVTAELSKDGQTVLVTFKYNPQLVKLAKRVPSWRFVNKDKPEGPAWRYNLDLVTMRKLREVFGADLQLGTRLKAWGHKAVAKDKSLAALSQANDAKLSKIGAKFAKWLRPYQRADVRFMSETNALNANQPRTGKTPTTIAALIEAGLEWGQHLVFAPVSSLRNVWEDGIIDAYSKQGLDEPTILTGDTPQQRREAIAQAKQLAEDGFAFWLVLNPAMARLTRKKVEGTGGDTIEFEDVMACPELLEVEWDSMTIDEYHLMGLSNPTTQGAKGVNHIAEMTQPAKRYALSGTPMGGKPIKLWGALHFLNPEEFTSRWNWARHWLVINHNGYGQQIEGIMPGREEDFYQHLQPYLVRRTQKEALPGLPPVQRLDVWCGMTPNQREQYVKFLTDAEWRMADAEENERLTATSILAEYTRLKQFANAYSEVKKTGREVDGIPQLKVVPTQDSGKLEQLLEKLAEEHVIVDKGDEDEAKCALVFTQFNGMVEMVAAALEERGVPTATISGKVTGGKRNRLIKEFQAQEPGAPRVMVMNTMAGGAAITLDRAETVHLLDETWVPDNQEQAENRATPTTKERMKREYRGVYYYRTRGTIEEYVQKLVADKALNNRTILDLRRRMQKQLALLDSE